VGVGDEDFLMMQALDADKGRLKNGAGKVASRDIVQFVKYQDYQSKGISGLAEQVLAEVPN